ncbi:flagellar basal body L-ring protein FlgH [Oxalobacteraceae bacterium R-40]|uniref:Flagellar L-ring protein n=1 Tax=Keguizhuia sedimenti TaxID=3064264 RepID=A0ABU1BPQ5_9BURK|nr:flagellar basal body L-ring protein FlgH [Oxalobacteraceae bacterium R-40]
MKSFLSIIVMSAAALSGCAVAPDSIVQHPTTARPVTPVAPAASNGAIFQAATYRPMFEDRRARMVGDTLVIVINERTSAGKSAANAASKNGSAEASVAQLFNVPASTLGKLGINAESEVSYDDKNTGSSSNNFSGTLAVTVIDVQPNGNLLVSGEKQVALDRGAEFIRFSGVVNPNTITGSNTVSSLQVADARLEYRTNSYVDKAQVMSIITRLFLSVLPL